MLLVNLLIFVIVLGLLVFFHEMGHFLAAKACGIYVDRFSLGMPPRIWGIRIGETDYCVGALPVGGYVKMAGQEDAPMDDEQREKEYGHVPPERWFNKKPIWQRYIVIAAGPFMNVVLAVVLYAFAGGIGGHVPEMMVNTRIGYVEPDSPADKAPLYKIASTPDAVDTSAKPDAVGWQPGDKILSINGQKTEAFDDIAIDAMLSSGKEQPVILERSNAEGGETRYLSLITPTKMKGTDHYRFGIMPFATALVGSVSDGMPAKEVGLKKGDVITKLDGKIIDRETFARQVQKLTNGESISLDVLRDGKTLHMTVKPKVLGRIDELAFKSPELDSSTPTDAPLVISAVGDALWKATGLSSGDVITKLDGKPANAGVLRKLENTEVGKTIMATVHQPPRLFGLVRPKMELKVPLKLTPTAFVGVVWGQKTVFYRVPPERVIPEAFNECTKAIDRTLQSIVLLITGNVSPREISGPVGIYRITTGAAHEGAIWLLQITAFISINLAIFNVLPLPVLDGGLLVFLTIEGVRRKPLDVRVLERIQQIGLAFILLLFLAVTFNDITRWVHDSMR